MRGMGNLVETNLFIFLQLRKIIGTKKSYGMSGTTKIYAHKKSTQLKSVITYKK